jgi:hypothetical protein
MQAAADDRRATFERTATGTRRIARPAECRRLVDYLARTDLPEPAVEQRTSRA